jgi:prolyl 4-hydroxylase
MFPDNEDLSGAGVALLRLQDTYALQADRVASGEIQGIRNSPSMTANDCYELGRIAYNEGDYYHTILWIQEALNLLDKELSAPTIDRATLLDYLAYATYMQGNPHEALRLTREFLRLEPGHTRATNNKRFYEDIVSRLNDNSDTSESSVAVKNERPNNDYRSSHEFRTYERLCRGEKTHVYKYEHKLHCRYVRHHPMFYIRPLKEEIAYFNPRIVIIHDAISDSEIELVKELATPRLARATVQNSLTGKLETANYRVSKSAWLKDIEHPIISKISQRCKAMSNLTLDTVEELQVVNYGIGGHYEPHFDFARKDEVASFSPTTANRIATVMFYMSDVEAGGATVFPELGVRLVPKKGSCALWYNLLRNGEGDYNTRHAACPVLIGSKWVSNKWFHERGQEFARPCSLNPNE